MDHLDEHDSKNDPDVMYDITSVYNYLDVSRISSTAVRYGVSSRARTAISTTTIDAAREAGLLK